MDIGIYIYDEAEVLDFAGPFEVFSTAKRLGAAHWNVCLIGETGQTVKARGGFAVKPHKGFEHTPALDVLVIAGGVHWAELDKPAVLRWLQQQDAKTRLTASVCTGAFLLAEAGLLHGLPVTTHWEDQQALQQRYNDLQVVSDRRWVEAGKIVTSGGISAGIDMSLYLVSRLASLQLAEQTARQMEYQWHWDSEQPPQS